MPPRCRSNSGRRTRRTRPHWAEWCSNRRHKMQRLSGGRSRRRHVSKKKQSKGSGRQRGSKRDGAKRSAVRRRGGGRIGRKRCRQFVSLAKAFGTVKDPRVNRRRRHLLIDIIVIPLCAVIGGADTWKDVQMWAESHHTWLAKFLVLPNGIPSRDTYRRVYDRLCPREFQACFLSWIQGLPRATKGKVVAIDGKTLRRSMDSATESPLLHLVSAWASDQHLTLGQVAVEGKSNEITAIPKLLKLMELKGALVTIDAMGCQKEIARQIRELRAHYVLALKGNHERIHADVQQAFTGPQMASRARGVEGPPQHWNGPGDPEHEGSGDLGHTLLPQQSTAESAPICASHPAALGYREFAALDLGCNFPGRSFPHAARKEHGEFRLAASLGGHPSQERAYSDRHCACETDACYVGR